MPDDEPRLYDHSDPRDGEVNPLLPPDWLDEREPSPPVNSKKRVVSPTKPGPFDFEPADENISKPEYWDELL